ADTTKGRLMSSIAKNNCDWAAIGSVRHPRQLPMVTSAEKGMRNFTDAAIQSQNRTAALFFRSARVSSPTTPTQNVDCTTWFTNGERSVIIIAGLSFLLGSLQSLFSVSYVIQRQPTELNQMCHDQIGPAAKERQQLVNETALGVLARDYGLKNVCIANSLNAAKNFLPLQAVYDCLNRRVGRLWIGKRFLNLSH